MRGSQTSDASTRSVTGSGPASLGEGGWSTGPAALSDSSSQSKAVRSLLVDAVSPCRLLCVHCLPFGAVTARLNSSVVTGATNAHRWPLYVQPSRTLTSTSALSRSKNQSRPA